MITFILWRLSRNIQRVGSRRYDADSLHKKNHAWKMIHEAYNSSCPSGNTRSLDQLKGLWNRLKVKTTQDRGQQRKEAEKTGRGEEPPEMDELNNYINEVVLPPHAKSPLHNPFDSDSKGKPLEVRTG
ncbi:unnamed protein product [Darwinula stevensoni]|uniref:Regulatory protein zeste n=1 Tax=Darwinula stevensoni TaxID=69355 RepID=A0A7R9AI68_9CRUS|nr:unnamed protein product [Darwinula stevensoni]CAG0906083.1 unnamed protein product [Darwinula stevensoni]